MKKIYSYIGIGIVALAFSACSQDDEMPALSEENVTMSIELNVGSRAELLNMLPDQSEYFVECNGQTSKVDYLKGTSTIVSPISLNSTYVYAKAFYPYSKTAEEFYLAEGCWLINAYDGVDYMYGQSTKVNNVNPKAQVTLHHALTYIRFVITTNEYLADEIKDGLAILEAQLKNVSMEGYINKDLNVASYKATQSIEFNLTNGDLSNSAVELGSFCMPYSKNDNTDKVISLFLNKEIGEIEVTIPNGKWNPEAGKIYTYYITIDGAHKGTLLPNVTISSWKNINSGEIIVK